MSGRVWTLSNALSLLRLALAVPIVLVILRNDEADRPLVAALIVLAAATDFFDGLIARRLGQVTDLGKIIDPVADKIVVAAAGAALVSTGGIPLWFFLAVVARDLLILAGGVYIRNSRGVVLQSNPLGKWTVAVLATYLLLAAVVAPGGGGAAGTLLLAASCAMMLASVVSYGRRMFNVLGRS